MTRPSGRRLFTILVVLGLVVASPFACERHIRQDDADQIARRLRAFETLAPGLPEADVRAIREALEVAEARTRASGISMVALHTLLNRFDESAADGVFTSIEAQHLRRLLVDLPDWDDRVHPFQYMGLR